MDLLSSTLRTLSADIVQKAKSGHPGMPLGIADVASVLWSDYLSFDPEEPNWLNRDRFILSAGHASPLLYSLLHLFGYNKVSLEELQNYGQFDYKTAGHPEYGSLPGIECTTGPLGQGIGMACGMALAEKMAQARFNTEDFKIINHNIFTICGDGCIMEGISAEASSLAGHFKLDNLILLYDSNNITIEGSTDITFSDDTAKRYESYGWKVYTANGHNKEEVKKTIEEAINYKGAPKLIIFKTHIAFGAPTKQDSASSHGVPLGEDEIKEMKKKFGLPEDKNFYIPEEVSKFCSEKVEAKKKAHEEWKKIFAIWAEKYPEKAKELKIYREKTIPENFIDKLLEAVSDKAEATRVSSGNVIQKAGEVLPFITGGSADLEPSVKCHIKKAESIKPNNFAGRNQHFGIREHAMGAYMNGMALYGLFIPYGATFLVFSDYMRCAIRLSAIMCIQVIYVFTHDSIFLGEDGPTHQPIEHIATLRIMPNLTVIRPADAFETAVAWEMAFKNKTGPTALILSRHNLPQLHKEKTSEAVEAVRKGGYVISKEEKEAKFVLIATGSEVSTAIEAQEILKSEGIDVRVVSMPVPEIFEKQSEEYQKSVILEDIPIVAIEATRTRDWDRFVKDNGFVIGMKSFGHSAPAKVLAEKFGFTGKAIAEKIKLFKLNKV